jgi:lipoyl(octanoyl) transferase
MCDVVANHGLTGQRLTAYMLGIVDFDAVLRLQRRLVYDVAGDRSTAALVVCEHSPTITVGRDGSREHIRFDMADLETRGWPVRWVNRGGGCVLHAPGQIVAYPIVALERMGFDLRAYLDRLHLAVIDTLAECDLSATVLHSNPGVCVGDRLIAHIGVAVRDWIAYYGISLNVNPDLEPFRKVQVCAAGQPTMTSTERERRSQVRIATVRQRLVEALAMRLGFDTVLPLHSHPVLSSPGLRHAVAAKSV